MSDLDLEHTKDHSQSCVLWSLCIFTQCIVFDTYILILLHSFNCFGRRRRRSTRTLLTCRFAKVCFLFASTLVLFASINSSAFFRLVVSTMRLYKRCGFWCEPQQITLMDLRFIRDSLKSMCLYSHVIYFYVGNSWNTGSSLIARIRLFSNRQFDVDTE